MTKRFITNLIRPWDELNAVLSRRYALQPDYCDITRLCGSLAVSIKHEAEFAGVPRGTVDTESPENKLMSDVGDAYKHGILKNSARQNQISVASIFEVNDSGHFRFMRNKVSIQHASLGVSDFMLTSGKAIEYWIGTQGLDIGWQASIKEAENVFYDHAFLFFSPQYQPVTECIDLHFLGRENHNRLIPVDPKQVNFVLYDDQKPHP
jgi:hypothetical protein